MNPGAYPRSALEETVLGLHPGDLLTRLPPAPNASELLRAWIPPSAEDLAPMFPQFEAISWVARGGMSAVYRAHQPALNRPVALKLLPAEVAADAIFAERFRTEARALAQLNHPNIVAVHDSGQTAAGHLFIVMEFVSGGTLAQLMAGGPMEVDRVLAIARSVCEALAFAHEANIIHRDIKPSNILLTPAGEVKVGDFGLARLGNGPASMASDFTASGTAVGTPDYMSPEQRAGRTVDTRSDIFSLGVVLYEMLTGGLPHGSWRPPSRVTASTPQLDALVNAALQPDPEDRLPSAAFFRAALDRCRARQTLPGRRQVLAATGACFAAVASAAWWWRVSPSAADARSSDASTARVPTAPAPKPLSPPGIHRPLSGLDLKSAAVTGYWHWQDETPGDILVIEYTHEKPSIKLLHLPVQPGPRSYDLEFELWLDHQGGSLIVVFPAGQARPALVLDMYDHSGLEMIREALWKTNETTVAERLPSGRFLPLKMTVRPSDERVVIAVEMEGRPFLSWDGRQADLSLPSDEYPPALIDPKGPGISLLSMYGAARVRAMRVSVQT